MFQEFHRFCFTSLPDPAGAEKKKAGGGEVKPWRQCRGIRLSLKEPNCPRFESASSAAQSLRLAEELLKSSTLLLHCEHPPGRMPPGWRRLGGLDTIYPPVSLLLLPAVCLILLPLQIGIVPHAFERDYNDSQICAGAAGEEGQPCSALEVVCCEAGCPLSFVARVDGAGLTPGVPAVLSAGQASTEQSSAAVG